MDQNLADHELVELIQCEQSWAFELLYDRYAAPIRSHLARFTRDEAAAEDLLQETFLRVWRHADQWTQQGSFKGWLFRIATNQALNYLRSRKRRPEQPIELPTEIADEDMPPDTPAWMIDRASLGPDDAVEQAEQATHLQQIIRDLPEEKLEVFRLVHQQEMSLRDAADELGIPEGTAKSRLHYARESLSRQWREWQDR